MNKQNFLKEESFPVSSQTFDFMQKQIEFVSEIARQFGDNVILRQPTADKNGLCVIGGELLELRYTNTSIRYYIVLEEKTSINAHGDTYEDARIERYAIGSFSYSGDNVTNYILSTAMVDMTLGLQYQMPKGAIIMWSGDDDNIPTGWALCNGQIISGIETPDLRGRFIVGYDESGVETDYDAIGKTGGEKTHQLTIQEMPSHSHDVYVPTRGAKNIKGGSSDHWHLDNSSTIYTNTTGGSQAHENRPPYYTLAFIIKIR